MKKREYEATHDYIEPDAEPRVISEKTVSTSKNVLRFARYLLLCILVLVIAITVISNRSSINVDNLRRLFAKIDIGVSVRGDVDGKAVELDYSDDSSVASFKDGIAFLTPSKLTVMDNLGTVFLSTDTGFSAPRLVTSDKYCVAFDRGGTHLIVSNSFAVVFDQNMKEPISYVSMESSGYLAVITMGGEYKNTLYVYDNSFKEVFVWHSNERYLLSAAVAPDHKNAVLACYNVKDGKNIPELVGLKLDSEEIHWTTVPEDGLPLQVTYKNSNLIVALHSDRLNFYNGKGKHTSTYEFEKSFLQHFKIDGNDYSVLVLSGGKYGNSTVCVVNNKGKVTARFEAEETVKALDVKKDRIALATDQRVVVCSSSSGKAVYEKQAEGNIQTVCFGGKNSVLDIYKTYLLYNEIK